jgi:hypothetical protein
MEDAFVKPKRSGKYRGWIPVAVLPLVVIVCFPSFAPQWIFMWTLSVAIFAGFKWLTWRQAAVTDASRGRSMAYLLLWPGMDADAFLRSADNKASSLITRPPVVEWIFALTKTVLGAVILWGLAHRFTAAPYLAGWIGMAGLIFMLHFGSFHLLSCFWRALGVNAQPLMNSPVRATSLSEFWGRRWNTAFRDLTHKFLFRPLAKRSGPRIALMTGFLASGLVHDLVISLPARGGFGGPTLFFALQCVGLSFERLSRGHVWGLGHGVGGWLFAAVLLAVPAPLLFHPPFVSQVILPMLEQIGAL